MASKTVLGVLIVIILIAIAYLLFTAYQSPSIVPTVPTTEITTQATIVSSVVGEEYSSLIQEELEKLSIEQTDFNSQTQDNIANDMSQFYY